MMHSSNSSLAYADGGKLVRVGNGCELICNQPIELAGGLEIFDGGKVSHLYRDSTGSEYYKLNLVIPGDLTIHSGGAVDVSGRGYYNSQGPGKTTVSSTGTSHGGRGSGGASYSRIGGSGKCYGSITKPVRHGSGGSYSTAGAQGGGAAKLEVAGNTVLDGAIRADANKTDHYSGAGGSVWLITSKLTGSGVISAHGGDVTSGQYDGAGGGGRISVVLTGSGETFDSFLSTGSMNAYGGMKASKPRGGPGTIYLQNGNEAAGEGKLIISNGDNPGYVNAQCRIDTDVTDTAVGSVEIAAKAELSVAAGQTLTFSKSWTNNGSFAADTDSTVVCDPISEATFTGNSKFYNFTAIAPGKTITFSTVDTIFEVAPNGKLTLQGDETGKLTLKSSVADTRWLAKVDATTDMKDMKYLHVIDGGIADGSAKLEATKSDGVNCDGWNFVSDIKPGEILTWTGAADGAFLNSENWEYGEEGAKQHRAPVATDNLVIGVSDNSPTLSADLSAWSLTVQSGATFNLAGFDVEVKNLTVAGTLVANGAETLAVSENAGFAGGTVDAKHTTLLFTGVNDQTFTPGSVTFANLLVEKDAGSITFADGFTADVLKIIASGAMTAQFAADKTVTAREVRFDGLVNLVASLTLKGVGDGAWTVNATSYSYARGVTVLNSTATGKPFDAIASSGSGCTGWTFNADAFVWTGGGTDSEFYNADNWENGQVPTATSKVVLDSAATITSSQPVEVAGLLLGGGDAMVSFTLSATLTVSGNLEVSDNATLVANQPVNVGGSVYVRDGGVITHGANAKTKVNTLTMNVTGELVIDVGGAINVVGKGYYGDNANPMGLAVSQSGPSYGGRGTLASMDAYTTGCYGNIFEPTELGAADCVGYGAKGGGGAVKLVVNGAITVNGSINACGANSYEPGGEQSTDTYYSGTGGSVWIIAASLNGSGSVLAKGGNVTSSGYGGGGRMAVYLTAADEPADTLTISAAGGSNGYVGTQDAEPQGGAGTIYVQGKNIANREGVLIVDGGRTAGSPAVTDLPAPYLSDGADAFKNVTMVFRGFAAINLTGDLTVKEVEIPSGARIYLSNHKLTIMSNKHKGKQGTYKGWVDATVTQGGDNGEIVFIKPGIIIIAR